MCSQYEGMWTRITHKLNRTNKKVTTKIMHQYLLSQRDILVRYSQNMVTFVGQEIRGKCELSVIATTQSNTELNNINWGGSIIA